MFIISNFLLVTLLLCLTSLFLPYWFVVDFYPGRNEINPTKSSFTYRQPSTTVTTTTQNASTTPASTTVNIFGRRKKREAAFELIFKSKFLKRRKRQGIEPSKVFDDLVIPKVHVGLFYMLYPYADFMDLSILSTRMVSLVHLEKNSPDFVVPKIMYVAQIFYSFGMLGLTIGTTAVFILACRKYSSVVGEIALGGVLIFTTMMLIIGVILAGIHTEGEIWDDFPVMNTIILNRAPQVKLDWGYYFSLIGPLLSILCTFLTWTQACSTCIDVEEIRKQQLSEIIAPDVAYQPLVSDRPYKTGHDNKILTPEFNLTKSQQEKALEAGLGEEFSI